MDFRTSLDKLGYDAATADAAQAGMTKILERSATDLAFRQKLVANPREAFAEISGVDTAKIPENVNIRFVESSGVPTYVLPEYVSPDGELSEADLETVSGGTTVFCVGVIVGLCIAIKLS